MNNLYTVTLCNEKGIAYLGEFSDIIAALHYINDIITATDDIVEEYNMTVNTYEYYTYKGLYKITRLPYNNIFLC